MEDEISKHTKKIYRIAKEKHHSGAEKFKDILIEILIIVFAVSLSIWLHNWSEKRHEQKEVKEFLTGLKEDLTKDAALLKQNRDNILTLDSNYTYIIKLVATKTTDTVYNKAISHRLYFNIPVSHLNTGRYDGFKSSGKIGNIEDDSLKQRILVFYQQTVPDITYTESYVNNLQLKILDWMIDRDDKIPLITYVSTSKMQAYLQIATHNFEVNVGMYNNTLQQIDAMVHNIDDALK